MKEKGSFLLTMLLTSSVVWGQEQIPMDLILEDPNDISVLEDELKKDQEEVQTRATYEEEKELDDLNAMKEDIGDIEFIIDEKRDENIIKNAQDPDTVSDKNPEIIPVDSMESGENVFNVGDEERKLLELATKMQGQIPNNEWKDITDAGGVATYTVIKNDWLWKISKRLFGSGYYYPKIWSLNPYITNPHEIEPGMVLTFTTGHQDSLPEFSLGKQRLALAKKKQENEFDKFGEDAMPDWMLKREQLKNNGKYVQYASEETDEDLKNAAKSGLNKEYEAYRPPRPDFVLDLHREQYDEAGFGKGSEIRFNYKQGFHLTTFVTSNVVQDFGKIDAAIEEKSFFASYDKVYLHFDENVNVMAGDKFSIYQGHGEISHENSDRKGFKYSINGSVQVVQRHGDVWECDILETTGLVQRGDRITVYTPKIERITKTFNDRLIEGVILAGFEQQKSNMSLGDIVYVDRGRADGVEQGNIFEVYGFKDRGTQKNITPNPTYKNGELTVITVTDNFATALVTSADRDFFVGDVAITKSKDAAARSSRLKYHLANKGPLPAEGLDELDVELNVDNLADDLLKKADRIEFTDDELAELDRREREKSIISESERDLKALERLEDELESAEKMMKEARLDEDRLLEDQSLEDLERKLLYEQQESLDEVEENFGKRFLDEELNDGDNPYGLTEFDIEEIDELLNVEKAKKDPETGDEVIDLVQ